MIHVKRYLLLSWCCLSICSIQGVGAEEPQPTGIEGNYYGVINNRYQTERFAIRIFRNAQGELDLRIDNLDQDKSLQDIKVDKLSITGDGISFYHNKLHTGFEGEFVAKNRVIFGTWTHSDRPPMHWPVSFARYDDENFSDKTKVDRSYAKARLPKSATFQEETQGIKLTLAYDECSSSFTGTIENLTEENIPQADVEVQLSGAVRLRLAAPVALEPGKKSPIKISAAGHTFVWWKARPMVGG